MYSQDAQQAALQTMLKVKLDSLWCHDKDKRVEVYLLLMYAHSIARPFTMDDWANEMEVEADDDTAHNGKRMSLALTSSQVSHH